MSHGTDPYRPAFTARSKLPLGLAMVPVGSGISNVSIRAWNIKVVSDPGQSQ